MVAQPVKPSTSISTHAPAGGATNLQFCPIIRIGFLLTPLREGRLLPGFVDALVGLDFYSRPCGRGDTIRKDRRYIA